MSAGAPPRLWLSLDALLDRSFFSRAAAPLEQLLRTTRASLTLRIESLPTQQLGALQRLLRRLARYGDRISIELDETLRGRVPIDSSVFHLVLSGQRPAARS
jgi:hypothetical protein